jgi:hypothetical protein
MSAKLLIAEARARGLPACAELLAGIDDWPEPAPPAAAQAGVPADHPLAAFDAVRRQGFAPTLVERLLASFESRPLERGLLAWDVLSGSLLRTDDKQLDRLRRDASAVAEILPKVTPPLRCVSVRDVDLKALVRRVAMGPYESLPFEEQQPLAAANALAAIEMYVTVDRESVNARRLRASAPRFAQFVDLAHASTLASFYLHYLWRRVGDRAALVPLLEVLADAGAEGKFNVSEDELTGPDPEALESIGYKTARMSARHTGSFYQDIQAGADALGVRVTDYRAHPAAEIAKTFQRSHIAYAHLGLMHGETPVPLDVVNAIVADRPDWRYARRVQAAMVASQAPPSSDLPLQLFDDYLATFGNDFPAWNDVSAYAPEENDWMEGLCRLLVREQTAQPHDVEAWRAFGPLFLGGEDRDAWQADIGRRLREQCQL